MSGLIICTKKEGTKPYYIAQAGVNISTLEELCYFLYNNIYIVNTEIIDEKLIEYIANELDEKPLADKLTELITYKGGLGELVMTILKYTGYYSKSEIEDIQKMIDSLNTQNVSERLKARGDSYLANQRYSNALENYIMILSQKKDATLGESFYGNVWHNAGVAFAKMFLFTKAKSCFERAYKIAGNPESRIQFVKAEVLADNRNKEFKRDDFASDEDREMYCEIKHDIDKMADKAQLQEEYSMLRQAELMKEDGLISEYYKKIEDIIENWKLDYKRLTQ